MVIWLGTSCTSPALLLVYLFPLALTHSTYSHLHPTTLTQTKPHNQMSDGEEESEANEDLALLGGGDLLTAKMELSTARMTLNEKLTDNKNLIKKVEELKNGLETQKSDAKDIYFYLHKKLDDNYNVIDNLEKVRVELTDDMEQKVNYYETELEKMRALRDQEIAALEATVQDQEEELFSLKEYKESKTMVEESMRTLAQELEEEKKMRQGKEEEEREKIFQADFISDFIFPRY